MYTTSDLKTEIGTQVARLEEQNSGPIHKQWLVTAVMKKHARIEGRDKPFALCCAQYAVEAHVDRYFRDVRQAEDDGRQTDTLPGFERLQKRYTCIVEEDQVIVRIQDMTDEQILAKAAEHRAMGDGHYRHADELERYVGMRRHEQAG